MTAVDFLSKLRELGVKVHSDGERLHLSAPKGVLTSSLKDELAVHKEEILVFLKRTEITESSSSSIIAPRPRIAPVPLSFSQERLWFLDQLNPGNYAYNMPGAIRLKGKLNLICLEQTLNEILARHEILRTNYSMVDNEPVQIIAPPKPLPLTIIDLSDLPSEEQTIKSSQLTEEEARRSFDLTQDLLVRATLLKLNAEEHIFLLTMHHIVSDGWSRRVFSQEFAALYEAFVSGAPNPLPPLPIQYADFACWQREWLQGERLSTQLAYWKQQLGGDLPQLELLLDKPRPAVQSLHSGRETLELSASLSQSLKELSQKENATLFMTLLAAFKLLLHRYTGVDDIIVGSPIAGRNRAELEKLIGFFINTLALRTDLSGNPSFRELIQRVTKTAMDAYTYQDIPFEKLLIELHPERNLSRTPLFQVFFNMLNLEARGMNLPDLTMELFESPDIGSKFDLTLYLVERDNALDLILVYNSDLFTPERITELLLQYKNLLTQVVVDPNRNITDYSLVTDQAKASLPDPTQALVSTWHEAVHTIFADRANHTPHNIALLDNLETWTYQELNTRSNQLANYLLANGIKPNDIIAVYGHRSASLVWALLGILKAGAAFLILDPAYPEQRLIDYLRAARPQGWLQLERAGPPPTTLQEFVSNSSFRCQLQLPPTKAQADALLSDYAVDDPQVTVGPDTLAYIVFTSGSTGQPKGIIGTHKPLSHFFHWHTHTFGFNQTDRFSMLSGLAHDPLLRDIFTPLWLGAALCIPDQEQILSPGQLFSWMQQQHISVVHLTPALEQLLIETTPNTEPGKLTALRYAFFGGETLTLQNAFSLKQLAPHVTCVNFYGATETPQAMGYAIVDLSSDLEANASNKRKEIVPLGRGIQDVQLLILNTAEHLAGVGEVGEIHIRTPYLSQGYLEEEDLTRQRFLVNPFTKDENDKMYKTGDLGRYLPNGNVEFLGRNDHQVKIRGFRIELSEVEVAIQHHPTVQQAVVSIWESETGDKRLVAYVVPIPTQSLQAGVLRDFLKMQLPDYMIPANFISLDAIPLTPNGKVNHKALPDPDFDSSLNSTTFVAPQTQTEKALAQIWADVLKLKQVGIHDNFFELGGHSILATQVISRIRKSFHVNLPLRNLFLTPTVAQASEFIDTIVWANRDQSHTSSVSRDEGEEIEF